jgi:dynein heavy chain, axonemal
MFNIYEKVKAEKTPFEVVALQELERMNTLLDEIRKSLEELKLGLQGALNVTEAMEQLQMCLNFNKVPSTWSAKAYFSKKNLVAW